MTRTTMAAMRESVQSMLPIILELRGCLVGCTLLLVCAQASHAQKDSDDVHMSVATWESIVHDMPACGGFASKDSGWTSWLLDRPPSVLRLPPTAHEVVRSRRPDYREWALPDSGGVARLTRRTLYCRVV